MKFFKWLLKSVVIALLLIFVLNILGVYININVPLNIWTLLVVTIFRLPGLIVLIIFFLL